jgi:hypothetical protein
MPIQPIPHRECGACAACCIVPVITDPALKKLPGEVCPHLAAGKGCTVYAARSETCRGHFCGWRVMADLDESWRPDLSNIFLNLKPEAPAEFGNAFAKAPYCLVITILGALQIEHLGGLVAMAQTSIQKEIPVLLTAAAPPGHVRTAVPLNPILQPYADGDNNAFAEAFVAALCKAAEQPVAKAVFGPEL